MRNIDLKRYRIKHVFDERKWKYGATDRARRGTARPWLLAGNGSFRPRVVSDLSRFGPGSFRPGSFQPGSFQPWVISAYFGGSFQPNFSQLSGLLPKVNKIHF